MNTSRLFPLVALLFFALGIASTGLAQTAGDFRSFQSGEWADVNSWERYDGGSWVNPAPNAPTTADGLVMIQSGDTITVAATDSIDELTVDADGVLVISAGVSLLLKDGAGTDLTLNGIMENAGEVTLDVGADMTVGGLYVHAQNGGTIPTATWESGSTCEVTGAVGNAPGNASQNFHNFTWNCPGQTSNLNVAWDNITIGGDVTAVNSGGSRFQFTSSTYSGTTITILGDVIVTGGALASNGSSGAATYTIEVMGDVTVTAGNLGVSRGSGGNATWRLYGDLSVSNATIQSSNNQSRFVFAKADTQTISFSSVTNSGTFHYEVDTSTVTIVADGPDTVDATINDSLICRGEVLALGALVFADGSVYRHDQNGGTIPTATWETGSLCEITGTAGNAPSNASQDFYNFTWNCPDQSSNLDWGWANNTIGGTVRVLSSGSSRARMTSPGATPDGPNVITILGDVLVENASFESNGSSSADTITIESFGNVSATGGLLAVSRGSGPMVMWNVYGDFTLDNAETRNSGGEKASYYFKKDGTQNLVLINPTFGGGGLPVVVESGATLNMDTSVVGGSGAFTVLDGAGLATAHPDGLNGSLQTTGTITLSESANYTFNGSLPQVTGFLLPDSVATLTFDNAAGVVMNDTLLACAELQVLTGTELSITDTTSFAADSGSVLGTVVNAGGFDGTASLIFGSGSVYRHDQNGGTIPTATWETGSLCEITGTAGNAPSNASQDFYNFTWNCPDQSSNLDWGWANNTIGGTVRVLSSGSSRARMTSPGATPDGPNVITILGDVLVENASFESNGSSSADTITIESFGNVSATGGLLAVSRGSGPMVMWNVYGDFTLDNAETRNSGGEKASYYFKKDGTQNLVLINPTFGGGGLPVVVESGATLNMDTSVVGGSGAFTVLDGAGLATAHPDGLNGSLQTTGTITLSESANYTFNGSVAQTTGTLLPAAVNTLLIDNPAGVTLVSDLAASDTLRLVSGTLALGLASVTAPAVAGGSSSAYLLTDGTGGLSIPDVGATEVQFPVGTAVSYAPVWITNAGTADAFTVSVAADAGTNAPRVELNWAIAEATTGGSDAIIQFGWMASAENAAFAADRAGNAIIYDLADTTEAGSGDYTGQLASEPYTLKRGGFTSFSPFAVGNFSGAVVSVGSAEEVPRVFALEQNYPNPFNPETVIRYDIPSASRVMITIYDALGRRVTQLVDRDHVPGFYKAEWNASGMASGVYYYRIVAGDFVSVKKMMLLR